MKKILGTLALALPALGASATYTGKISVISMNNNGNQIVFEVVDRKSSECDSSWFKVPKPANRELSPAELVVNAYYSKERITLHSPDICSSIAQPGKVNRVTIGTSQEETQALIEKYRAAKNKENSKSSSKE